MNSIARMDRKQMMDKPKETQSLLKFNGLNSRSANNAAE
jgi:hypothetical protein